MKNPSEEHSVSKNVADVALLIEQAIITAEKNIERKINPFRDHVTKRFPTLFILLSTFGLIATYLGMEQILLQYNVTEENPLLLIIVGVSVLVFTGTLYKKLG
jgi:succinate dehydrogenase hydrophobic anchor subunit